MLLLSAEAYVPWELATMPHRSTRRIGFLGAQVTSARWVLAADRPSLPPPRLVHVDGMIVISGRYEQPGWSRLEHAEAEAAALVERYHAIGVDAVTDRVLSVACSGTLRATCCTSHSTASTTRALQSRVCAGRRRRDRSRWW